MVYQVTTGIKNKNRCRFRFFPSAFSLQPKHLFLVLLTLTLFCCATVNGAGPQEPENQQKISRVATFSSHGGQKLLHSPLALALDGKNGDLIVTSFGSGEVIILDKNGSLVKRMGAESGLVSPYGVAIDDKGLIYVSEIETGMLKVFSPGGVLVDEIDLSKVTGRPVSPGKIMLDKDGLIYVADLRDNEILIFTVQGDHVQSVGNFAQLQKAAMINDKIVGLSAYGKAVSLFDKKGTLLSSFGGHEDGSGRNFSFPAGFAIDAKNRLWIADAFQHRLKVFSLEGEFLFNFGRMQEKTGGFFFPVDLCFGDKGKLFVLEKGAERIQLFHVDDLDE